MSDIESYDGLCGIIPTFASSNIRVRCTHCLGHAGPCSFEKYRHQFQIIGGTENRYYAEDKFVESVLASLKK